jgi:hypothetical protein
MKILFDTFLIKNIPENCLGQLEKNFGFGNSGGNGLTGTVIFFPIKFSQS